MTMTTTNTNTDTTITPDRIEKRVTLRAPQARVWAALANAEEFGRWFGFTLEGPFTPGKVMKGTFNGKIDENAIIEAQKSSGIKPSKLKVLEGTMTLFTVDRMEAERYFSFRWIPFGIDAEADPENEPMTLVEFRLEPVAEGTALTIIESGFERVPAHRRARAFRMNNGGWAAQAENLRKYVDGA
jgi:uncharacterized protein YndB with AHSA1/START domain